MPATRSPKRLLLFVSLVCVATCVACLVSASIKLVAFRYPFSSRHPPPSLRLEQYDETNYPEIIEIVSRENGTDDLQLRTRSLRSDEQYVIVPALWQQIPPAMRAEVVTRWTALRDYTKRTLGSRYSELDTIHTFYGTYFNHLAALIAHAATRTRCAQQHFAGENCATGFSIDDPQTKHHPFCICTLSQLKVHLGHDIYVCLPLSYTDLGLDSRAELAQPITLFELRPLARNTYPRIRWLNPDEARAQKRGFPYTLTPDLLSVVPKRGTVISSS